MGNPTTKSLKRQKSVKNKFFTRKFVPAAQSLQVMERKGYYYEKENDRYVIDGGNDSNFAYRLWRI